MRHQGAAAGSQFDQSQHGWRTDRLPYRRRPQPEQFAEHLAHLGRGDEIALAHERIARNVIAVLGMRQAQLHVTPDRHRPGRLDELLDFGLERRIFAHGLPSIGFGIWFDMVRRHATTIMIAPAMIIGTDNSMPMVSPPHKNPSCGSGSRKNSPTMRPRP